MTDIDLKKEISTFVQNKIKDVKYVDEVLTIGHFKIAKPQYENNQESYEKLFRFKKISQLLINSLNNNKIYEKFSFKFVRNENAHNDFDSFDCQDGSVDMWKVTNGLKKQHVVDALFNYVLCFLSIDLKEESIVGTADEREIIVTNCAFCDQPISKDDLDCSVCGATVIDIRKDLFLKVKPGKIDGDKIDESTDEIKINRRDLKLNERKEERTEIEDVSERKKNMKEDIFKKWKCGKCGLLNEYSCGNCDVCGDLYEYGTWTCEMCMEAIGCDTEECRRCVTSIVKKGVRPGETHGVVPPDNKGHEENVSTQAENNGDMREGNAVFDRTKEGDYVDKWKCGGCGFLNKYELGNCEACGKLLKEGSWVCEKCKKDYGCDIEKCIDCKYSNDKIMKIADDRGVNEGRVENNGNEGNRDYGDMRGGIDAHNETLKRQGYLNDNAMDHDGGKLFKEKEKVEDNNRMKREDYIKKWMCGKCELLNEYTLVNCTACGALIGDGKWTCGSCNKENSCVDYNCSGCDKRNDNKVMGGDVKNIGGMYQKNNAMHPLVKGDKSGNIGTKWDGENSEVIPEDQWRCGNCQLRQSYKNINCSVCVYSSRLYNGQWQCHQCTMVNKCDCERCGTCGTWSKYLPEKYCMDCKTSRIVWTELVCEQCARSRNIEWKCRYTKCGKMNRGFEEYCSKCRLWRHNPFGRGDECRRYAYYGIERVWVCHKCEKVHSVTSSKCYWSCVETRYGQMTCDNCHKSNDGTSDSCYYCRKILPYKASVT